MKRIIAMLLVALGLRASPEELKIIKAIKPGMKVVGRGGLTK
jgi:hypothetical protein